MGFKNYFKIWILPAYIPTVCKQVGMTCAGMANDNWNFERAYGSVVERGIRIAETAVRFCLGPQKGEKK